MILIVGTHMFLVVVVLSLGLVSARDVVKVKRESFVVLVVVDDLGLVLLSGQDHPEAQLRRNAAVRIVVFIAAV